MYGFLALVTNISNAIGALQTEPLEQPQYGNDNVYLLLVVSVTKEVNVMVLVTLPTI
jgi:hypothetical protein